MKKLALALLLMLLASPALAQSTPQKFLTTASNNATLARAGAAQLRLVITINTTTTLYYLKFYDTAGTPVCTNPAVLTLPVPFGAGSSGGGFVFTPLDGLQFFNGVGFCVVGALADGDNSNAAAGIAVNLGIKQ